jgi:very-short-patch-repair endonuclease
MIRMESGIDRCESPLERILVEAFARCSRWEWTDSEPEENCPEIGWWPGWGMALLCQVAMGRYRADLVIAPTQEHPDVFPWIVVVEVDGHDFHERTKEQARHDKRRDRFFTESGATVLRFTGSEVHRDPLACAEQAWWVAARKQEKEFNAAFRSHLCERVVDRWEAFDGLLDWLYPGRPGFGQHHEVRGMLLGALVAKASHCSGMAVAP